MARAYHVSEEDRAYMELETREQTMESHVEEYEFILGQGRREQRGLFMALTRSVNLSHFRMTL